MSEPGSGMVLQFSMGKCFSSQQRSLDYCYPPARKRQRLSSPDDYFEELSQEDLAAIDRIEARLSQGTQSPSKNLQRKHNQVNAATDPLTVKDKENLAPSLGRSKSFPKSVGSPLYDHRSKSAGIRDDPDNPFVTGTSSFTSAKLVDNGGLFNAKASSSTSGFVSAFQVRSTSSFQDDPQSSSPENPPEQDYSTWFAPELIPPSAQFQTAKFAAASSIPAPTTEVLTTGFMKASNKGWAVPSRTALAQAEEKMKQIWREEEAACATSSTQDISLAPVTDSPLPLRSALQAVQNSPLRNLVPDTPAPVGFGKPPGLSVQSVSSLQPPALDQLKGKAKPFKSPLMAKSKPFHLPVPGDFAMASSPLNPNRSSDQGFMSAGSQQHLFSTPTTDSPLVSRMAQNPFVTPLRPLRVPPKAKFITPFKIGMKPGEPGRKALPESLEKEVKLTATSKPIANNLTGNQQHQRQDARTTGKRLTVFNLCAFPEAHFGHTIYTFSPSAKPPSRQTLLSSGLVPQSFDSEDLECMGMFVISFLQLELCN
jgi:breast cancer 2 susceptibility protein